MALLPKTQQRLLGIDISSTAIKLIELSRSESKGHHEYRVDAFASGNLPPGSVDARKIKDTAAVSEVITEVVSRSGSSAKQAAVAVSGAAVISRVIQLPAGLSELEMESMVSLEADHYIPQRLDEVRYDFDVIGPSQNNPETVDVLLAAARGDVVDDLIMVLENAGLTAQVVDAEQYAVEHCYQELVRFDQDSGNANNVAVIDIGANTMDVHVIVDGNIRHTREYHIGGRQLTQDIQNAYNLEPEEAEVRKISGDLPGDYRETLLQPFVKRLAQDMRGALQIYQASDEGANIQQIFLTGGCANLTGITDLVENLIGIPVRILDPFASMKFGKNVHLSKLREQAPAFTVACGLALRRFD
ncbi:MAG: type IV pilus assembly protein PilM [Gammaproteobacteria bacterium]|jgi:type IV pilus assembly protein PilM